MNSSKAKYVVQQLKASLIFRNRFLSQQNSSQFFTSITTTVPTVQQQQQVRFFQRPASQAYYCTTRPTSNQQQMEESTLDNINSTVNENEKNNTSNKQQESDAKNVQLKIYDCTVAGKEEWRTFQEVIPAIGIIPPKTDSNNWIEDYKATAYANELLNAKYEELGAGVHMYALNTYLQSNERKSTPLFTRNHSRDLWHQVYAYLQTEHDTHAVVTGNPGIGKSRTLNYLLKLLLDDGQLVVYETRKDTVAYIFVPVEKHYDKNKEVITKYKVWSCAKESTDFSARACAALHNPNNYYLIDPSKPAEITNLPAHTVIAASPNTAHYKEWAKRGNTPEFCMPPWSYEELLAIKAHVPYKLTDIEFKARFEYFGGRPRFIFASTLDYRRYKNDFDKAVKELTEEKLSTYLNGSIAGADAASSKDSSMLFMYDLVEPEKIKPPMYISDNFLVKFASIEAFRLVVAKFWESLMNMLDPTNKHFAKGSPSIEYYFESLSFAFLRKGGTFKILDLQTHKESSLTLPPAKWIQCGNKKDFEQRCLLLPSEPEKRTLLRPGIKNQPVADFADAPNRLYQVTLGREHKIKGKHLLDSYKASPSNPIDFYFVVPCNYSWEKQSFEGCNESEKAILAQSVRQYALFIPLDTKQDIAQLQQFQAEALFTLNPEQNEQSE